MSFFDFFSRLTLLLISALSENVTVGYLICSHSLYEDSNTRQLQKQGDDKIG